MIVVCAVCLVHKCSLLGRGSQVANAIDQSLATGSQRQAAQEAGRSNNELRIAARIRDPTNVPGD
jgi:hypothetical protein